MAGQSAKDTVVRAFLGSAAPTWDDTHNIAGANNASVSLDNGLLEVTDFDSEGYREKIKGLKQVTGSFDAFVPDASVSGSVLGYGAIVNYNFNNPTDLNLYIQVVPAGNTTLEFQAVTPSMDFSNSVDGTKDVSIPFESTGAFTFA